MRLGKALVRRGLTAKRFMALCLLTPQQMALQCFQPLISFYYIHKSFVLVVSVRCTKERVSSLSVAVQTGTAHWEARRSTDEVTHQKQKCGVKSDLEKCKSHSESLVRQEEMCAVSIACRQETEQQHFSPKVWCSASVGPLFTGLSIGTHISSALFCLSNGLLVHL